MKAKYKEIKEIIANTPNEQKGVQISSMENMHVGYYQHHDANWSYRVHVINHNNRLVKVVSVFGEIKAE